MQNRQLIQRLSTILPGWRHLIKTPEIATYSALRWQIDNGTIFEDADAIQIVQEALAAQHAESSAVQAELAVLMESASRWRRVPISELKRRTHNFKPGWGEWAKEEGYVFNIHKSAWYREKAKDPKL